MVVPSAELTVLMGSTFLGLFSDRLKILKKLSELGLLRTAAFAHFVVRVETIAARFDFTD
jgi:hypothetical protein